MTMISKPDTFSIPGQPDESIAPSGVLEYSHGEQVELYDSTALLSVAELVRRASELATPTHQVEGDEAVDQSRLEFGSSVVDIARYPTTAVEERYFIRPDEMVEIGSMIVELRNNHAGQQTAQTRE